MKPKQQTNYEKHPCFNPGAKGSYGRVHLPVAPKCNIKCNFCDRKYDCVNESRPGVTSNILTPDQAGVYMQKVLDKEPRISVAGIAGPGDPFANGPETIATLRTIRRNHPQTLLCVSTNGMGIGPYIDTLAELEVSHVTITICAVDPAISEKIYSWVSDGNIIYRGRQGASLLLDRQKDAIRRLKEYNITVKVNCIVIPGINDHHVEEVAKTVKELGADLLNCMALFPNSNTVFANIDQPSKKTMETIRQRAEKYLPQMRHCTRCRADAVGLLDEDRTDEFRGCLSTVSNLPPLPGPVRPYVAVATEEGILINQHLGEATSFQIWEQSSEGFRMVETRPAPRAGGGIRRWTKLSRVLRDCRAILVSGFGTTPGEILLKSEIRPVEAAGFIEDGLTKVFANLPTESLKGRRSPCADGACSGSGGGCG